MCLTIGYFKLIVILTDTYRNMATNHDEPAFLEALYPHTNPHLIDGSLVKKSSDWVAKKSNVKLVFYHHGREVSTLKSPPILQIAHTHMISLIVDGRGFH